LRALCASPGALAFASRKLLDRWIKNFGGDHEPDPWRSHRVFFFTPAVPSDRVALLRKAFDATMLDKDFLAEAQKLKMEIEPTDGASLDKTAREIIASPASAVVLAKQLIGSN
jgi:hypothetical protein